METYIIREENTDGQDMYRAYDCYGHSLYIGRPTLAEAEAALRYEINPDDNIEYRVKRYADHLCGCGKAFKVPAGLHTYGRTLRCHECSAARKELLTAIYDAMVGVRVEELRISLSVRHLVSLDDFDSTYEICFIHSSKMAGSDYEVV